MRKVKYSTVKEIKAAREKKAAERKRKSDLIKNKEELGKRLVFQSQMGNRVRAAIWDREAGRRVVEENNENTRRIGILKQLIQREEKDQ